MTEQGSDKGPSAIAAVPLKSAPLGDRVRLAFVHTIAARQGHLIIGGIALLVLARLLTPEDYGVFALLFAAFLFAETLATFGIKATLVKEDEVGDGLISSALGLALGLSLSLSVLGLAMALFLSPPYQLPSVFLALALLPFAPALVGQTLLERDLSFGHLSLFSLLRALIDVATAVGLALLGWGPAALAAGVLAERLLAGAVFSIYLARKDRLRPKLHESGRFVAIGRDITLANSIPMLSQLAITSFVSGYLGAAALGLLNRARTIDTLLDNAVLKGLKPVMLPAFSSALRQGTASSELYLSKVDKLACVCWPLFAGIIVFADPLVEIILGQQWEAAVAPLRILAVGGLAIPLTRMSAKFFVALGETQLFVRLQMAHHTFLVLLSAAAALVSIEAVAAAISASFLFKAVLLSVFAKRLTGYASVDFWNGLAKNGLVTAITAAPPTAIALMAGEALGPLPLLLVAGVTGALCWLAALFVLNHPLSDELRKTAHALRPKRSVHVGEASAP